MKAVALHRSLPIDNPESLVDTDLPNPTTPLATHDLLVEVRAISVNPVDTKVRMRAGEQAQPKVLGWDAAGVVTAVGSEVAEFAVGAEVYYSGDLNRPGTNAEFHLVDAALVGHKPQSLSFEHAAALPLTAITAWELLFDRLAVPEKGGSGTLLITGGAGGVGSILIQLARQLTQLQVVATASRPETVEWCRSLGAHHVIDHTRPLQPQLDNLHLPPVGLIASLTGTTHNYPQLVEILAPQGKIAVIDDPETLDALPLKRKSASLHWEFMFARSMWNTPDKAEQGKLLERVAQLVDQGVLRTTHTETLGPINAANLREAHARLESGRTIGKLVLAGF